MDKYRIMFVCHGNICRSPMAEAVLRHLAQCEGISDRLLIASSATSTEEIYNGVGNPIYPAAGAELMRHGIEPPHRQAVQLCNADYGKYDMLVGMDSSNVRNMHRILGGDRDGKITRLLDLTDTPADVADPWYSGRFDIAYRDIYRGCVALLAIVKARLLDNK